MKTRITLYIKLFIFALLFVDIIFAIFSFRDYDPLSVLVYSIISAAIYLFLFSANREMLSRDMKLYAIISLISIFLFTYITFGPYFGFTGLIFIPTLLFTFFSYIYYILRTKYNEIIQVTFISSIYLITKVCLIFFLICGTALIQ